MFVYRQGTGEILDDEGVFGLGYAGHGPGKNNGALQDVKNVGPIPRGAWRIVGEPFNSKLNGPFCLRLQPLDGTETFGRSGFLIHGDSFSHPGEASRGCIILPRSVREKIWASGYRLITVVA
jgi:hypothetical protein